MTETTKRQRAFIKAAAVAHTDLNMFEAVTSLLGHSMVSSDCERAVHRIAIICRTEQQKCLRRYDAAMLKAGGGEYGA